MVSSSPTTTRCSTSRSPSRRRARSRSTSRRAALGTATWTRRLTATSARTAALLGRQARKQQLLHLIVENRVAVVLIPWSGPSCPLPRPQLASPRPLWRVKIVSASQVRWKATPSKKRHKLEPMEVKRAKLLLQVTSPRKRSHALQTHDIDFECLIQGAHNTSRIAQQVAW